ncbi:unnamed protein product [Amoebophrya sp. A120]|nr:unnamed protein product [Amoebophrya sp. A120]|eukprot:GSA120T00007233001.1
MSFFHQRRRFFMLQLIRSLVGSSSVVFWCSSTAVSADKNAPGVVENPYAADGSLAGRPTRGTTPDAGETTTRMLAKTEKSSSPANAIVKDEHQQQQKTSTSTSPKILTTPTPAHLQLKVKNSLLSNRKLRLVDQSPAPEKLPPTPYEDPEEYKLRIMKEQIEQRDLHEAIAEKKLRQMSAGPFETGIAKSTDENDSRALQSLGMGTGIPRIDIDPKTCYLCDPANLMITADEPAGFRCVKRTLTSGYEIRESLYLNTEETIIQIKSLADCMAVGGNYLEPAQRFCRDINLEAFTRAYDNDILCLAYKREYESTCCRPMNQQRCTICGTGIDAIYGVMERTQTTGAQCMALNTEPLVMSGFIEQLVVPDSQRRQFYRTPMFDIGETSNLRTGVASEREYALEGTHDTPGLYKAKLVTEKFALSPCTHRGGSPTRPFRSVMACTHIQQVFIRVENLVPGALYRYELFQYLEENPWTLNTTYNMTMDVQRLNYGDTPVGSNSPSQSNGNQNKISDEYLVREPYIYHKKWNPMTELGYTKGLNEPAQEGYAHATGIGTLIMRIYASSTRDSIILSGLNIRRASNMRQPENMVTVNRYVTDQRCAIDGGYENGGGVTCNEVEYHWALNFRKGSEGCEYLQQRFTHGYCDSAGVRQKGCCRGGNPAPLYCTKEERDAAAAAAAALNKEDEDSADVIAQVFAVIFIVILVLSGIVAYCFGRQIWAQIKVFIAQEENRQFFARMTDNQNYGTKVGVEGQGKKKRKKKKKDDLAIEDVSGERKSSKDGTASEKNLDEKSSKGEKSSKDEDQKSDTGSGHQKPGQLSRSATRDSVGTSKSADDDDNKSVSSKKQTTDKSPEEGEDGSEEEEETDEDSSDSDSSSADSTILSAEAARKRRHKERKEQRILDERAERMKSLAQKFYHGRGFENGVGNVQPAENKNSVEEQIQRMKERAEKKERKRQGKKLKQQGFQP